MNNPATCTVWRGRRVRHCGAPATRVITSECEYGHTETFAVCADDEAALRAGWLTCTPCSQYHDRATRTYPRVPEVA